MNVETFLANFDRLAEAPNGIPQLRELILKLAVSGKLVPQDPEDEPASELLKKIQGEKQRLIAEGVLRESKPLPMVTRDEMAHLLPTNWAWVRLGDVTTYGIADKTAPGSAVEGTWILELEDIQKVSSVLLARLRYPARDFKSSKSVFHRGDVLYGKLRPYLDKVLVADEDGVCTTEIIPFHGYIDLESSYLRIALKSPDFVASANDSTHGMNLPRLGTEKARMSLIPIAPLAEQKRIVAKVDELMALCGDLEAKQQAKRTKQIALNRASLHALTQPSGTGIAEAWHRVRDHFDHIYATPETVAELRQHILQLAVMGRLVPQDPNDLPAPQPGKHFVYALSCDDGSIYIGQTRDVLERWKQHAAGQGADWTKKHPPVKLAHWEEYDSIEEAVKREKDLKTGFGRKWLKREIAAGRTRQAGEPASVLLKRIQAEKQRLIAEGVIRKPKPLPPIDPNENACALSTGWEWVHLWEIYDVRDGTHDTPKYVDSGIPLVTSKNIYGGKLDLSNVKYISEAAHEAISQRSGVEVDDILLAMIGSIGNPALVDVDTPFSIKNVALFKYYSKPLSCPRYLLFFLTHAANDMRERSAGGVQSFVSLTYLRAYSMPLPPLAEQKRIVAKVDDLMTLCDDLETKLQQTQTDADNLLSAIVHELVGT